MIADVTLSRSLAVISHAKIESLEVSREDVAGDEEKQWGWMGEESKRRWEEISSGQSYILACMFAFVGPQLLREPVLNSTFYSSTRMPSGRPTM